MTTDNSDPLLPETNGQPKPARQGKLTADQRRFAMIETIQQ